MGNKDRRRKAKERKKDARYWRQMANLLAKENTSLYDANTQWETAYEVACPAQRSTD